MGVPCAPCISWIQTIKLWMFFGRSWSSMSNDAAEWLLQLLACLCSHGCIGLLSYQCCAGMISCLIPFPSQIPRMCWIVFYIVVLFFGNPEIPIVVAGPSVWFSEIFCVAPFTFRHKRNPGYYASPFKNIPCLPGSFIRILYTSKVCLAIASIGNFTSHRALPSRKLLMENFKTSRKGSCEKVL